MNEIYDVIIVGGGSAAASAALTLANRQKTFAVIANPIQTSNLYKAEMIKNYPGIGDISGQRLAEIFQHQLKTCCTQYVTGHALTISPLGETFGVAVSADFYEARSVIIATGISQVHRIPGEDIYLGNGISYCATCDGMLYKNKNIVVTGSSEELEEDLEFLRKICSSVSIISEKSIQKFEKNAAKVVVHTTDQTIETDGVFVLRSSITPETLVPGLKCNKNGAIAVDQEMATNISGIFACGDCTGSPYQVAKAVGQGNIAALTACNYIFNKGRRKA